MEGRGWLDIIIYFCEIKGRKVLKDEKMRHGEIARERELVSFLQKNKCSAKKHVRDDEMGCG